jgi:nitrate reductase cytochrome c-type subunit
MPGHQCWKCEDEIERSDTEAVIVSLCNLWQYLDGVEQQMSRDIFFCSSCAERQLSGSMDLELKEMSEPWED